VLGPFPLRHQCKGIDLSSEAGSRHGSRSRIDTARRAPPPHSRPRPQGVSQRPRDGGTSGSRTETVQAGPGTPSRLEEQAPSHTPRRRQDRQTRRVDQGTPSPPRINAKLRSRSPLPSQTPAGTIPL
jgi:hypothetical protein